MIVSSLNLPEVFELVPTRHGDERGFFSETYTASTMKKHGFPVDWVQDNFSKSVPKHVLRGLHYQNSPKAQDKLVRVVRGSIFDVAVDIRKDSPNFGRWVGLVLSEKSWNQIFIPKGFAHGFLTLEPETEVAYKVTEFYSPEHDRSIAWNDPDINVAWPTGGADPIISDKDARAPRFAEAQIIF